MAAISTAELAQTTSVAANLIESFRQQLQNLAASNLSSCQAIVEQW